MPETPDILKKIVLRKEAEVALRAESVPLPELAGQVDALPPTRGFAVALRSRVQAGGSAVIAEIKKASPSKGVLREAFEPSAIARQYEDGGAACLSVLTDRDFFQGADQDLVEARNACGLPVLRKDFIVDPYQVYESRCLGADCILLIVACLEDAQLRDYAALALDLGLDVLVEVHDAAELKRALELPQACVLGINNRDLRTFDVRLETTLILRAQVPSDRLLVTESGIHTTSDVGSMRAQGIHAFLVGESFMRAADPGAKLAELFG